jgi:hypothetical protein
MVTIPAFGSKSQSFDLGTITPAGSYTYAVIIDPANTISEENKANNSEQVTILVADQDITFGSTAAAISIDAGMGTPPNRTLTATFEILHTVNTTAPTPPAVAIDVDYTITLNAATVAGPTTVSVDPAGTNPLPISVPLPATGSAGSFPYVITLSPAVGDDNKTNNNTVTVVVTVPASG